MKKNITAFSVLFFTLLFIFVLALWYSPVRHYASREWEYHTGEPTAAEQQVHDYAKSHRIPYGKYPEELITLLENNPETESFVLGYPTRKPMEETDFDRETVPLFLQWDPRWGYEIYGSSFLAITGCGPTCLAMAGYYLTGDDFMLPHTVAAFAEENGFYVDGKGSAWALMTEGAQMLGLSGTELPLDQEVMEQILTEDGTPIIVSVGAGDFTSAGHFILLTGVEEGGFRVNDPNSILRSKKLWTYEQLEGQIRNLWAIGVSEE